jgi:hypothetical protein
MSRKSKSSFKSIKGFTVSTEIVRVASSEFDSAKSWDRETWVNFEGDVRAWRDLSRKLRSIELSTLRDNSLGTDTMSYVKDRVKQASSYAQRGLRSFRKSRLESQYVKRILHVTVTSLTPLTRHAALECNFRDNVATRDFDLDDLQVNGSRYADAVESLRNFVLHTVSQCRNVLKTPREIVKRTKSGIEYSTTGGVFTESNSLREIMKRFVKQRVTAPKSPLSRENHIGIEIECMIDDSNSIDDFYAAIVKGGLANRVCVKGDGSIDPDEGKRGVELTLCATETEIFNVVKSTCEVLDRFDVTVNKSCGLHIHLDMRNRSIEDCGERLVRSQPLLFAMVPETRRTNNFCAATHPDCSHHDDDRYKAVNLTAYSAHRTVEVRLHSATHNATKINNWIAILLKIIDAEVPRETPVDLKAWSTLLNLDTELTVYVMQRVALFNTPNAETNTHCTKSSVNFFRNVRRHTDNEDNESTCDCCGSNVDDCDCYNCEDCGERVSSDDSRFDSATESTYCVSCYDSLIETREADEAREAARSATA